MIRVLYIDRNEIGRKASAAILSEYIEIEVVGSVESGEEAIEICKSQNPDVILMYLRMKHGMSALDTARAIKEINPKIKIIALPLMCEDEHKNMIINKYFDSYIMACEFWNEDRVVDAIKVTFEDLHVFSSSALDLLLHRNDIKYKEPPDIEIGLFSEWEMKILTAIAEGKTYKEIGSQIQYSERYVRTKAKSMIDRLELKNVKELAAWGSKRGV